MSPLSLVLRKKLIPASSSSSVKSDSNSSRKQLLSPSLFEDFICINLIDSCVAWTNYSSLPPFPAFLLLAPIPPINIPLILKATAFRPHSVWAAQGEITPLMDPSSHVCPISQDTLFCLSLYFSYSYLPLIVESRSCVFPTWITLVTPK